MWWDFRHVADLHDRTVRLLHQQNNPMWIGLPDSQYSDYLCGWDNLSFRGHNLWLAGDVLGCPLQLHLDRNVQENNMYNLSHLVYLYTGISTFQPRTLQQKEETSNRRGTVYRNVISLLLSD